MKWGEELKRIRRFLRDSDGNIWGEELLRKLWYETAVDVQRQVRVLEDMRAISVPPRFEWGYTHDFEHEYTTLSTNAVFHQQGGHFTFTGMWEVQEFSNWDADVSDDGAQITFPWEAWFDDVGKPVGFPFPRDFRAVRRMYYDREPLPFLSKKEISLRDPTWRKRSGEPQAYYREDEVSNHFFLWPRPSTASWVDDIDTGMVTATDDTDESGEVGTVLYSNGLEVIEDKGATFDVVDIDDALLLIMEVDPLEPTGLGAEIAFPTYLVKYVRFGVLARAYAANTDGRIESLARFWLARYQRGIEDIRDFMARRSQDRDYRMVTQRAPLVGTKPKHPRLPDGYPAVNP